MSYALTCILVFLAAYGLNIIYVSVFYHRGLAHEAIILSPWMRRFVIATGNWVTGIDPKAWSCMHRLHHQHSDTEKDPHSPINVGTLGVMYEQLKSYKKVLGGLIVGRKQYTTVVSDLNFPVSTLNQKGIWYAPYLLHAVIAVTIGLVFNAWILALCYWVGIMSHPIQGWMVNALAHKFGYRNFESDDNSKNNTAVALLVFGEGFQNNHHHFPNAARFSVKWWEVDMGYGICRVFKTLGILSIR